MLSIPNNMKNYNLSNDIKISSDMVGYVEKVIMVKLTMFLSKGFSRDVGYACCLGEVLRDFSIDKKQLNYIYEQYEVDHPGYLSDIKEITDKRYLLMDKRNFLLDPLEESENLSELPSLQKEIRECEKLWNLKCSESIVDYFKKQNDSLINRVDNLIKEYKSDCK